jgi:hypothetical protein
MRVVVRTQPAFVFTRQATLQTPVLVAWVAVEVQPEGRCVVLLL